ncbi:GyrI-like domain-containing protein [uncultured Rubinisphaera sp.]|uniref:SRPBCC family protein n=1 Tax=uncultured Rubinisphaera sp. TaxID=1678686 RepID=UPI0030DA1D44|tara:strand:+ start:321 stop:1256 length:936 start_codon:yes stop_codon:yes gene_type:complete
MPRFQVQRSLWINASPDIIYENIVDYRTWTTWSPWLPAQPDAEVTVSENSSSLGSKYSWKGEVVGEGEIEHRNLQPPELIEDEIRFRKPFPSTSQVTFELKPERKGTLVTWGMIGALPWFLFWMKSMMQDFISMDYDRGLKMLKEWIETGEVLSKTNVMGVQKVGPLRMAGVRKVSTLDDISQSMQSAFQEAEEKFSQHNIPRDGDGISVYHSFNCKTRTFDYTAGFIIEDSSIDIPLSLKTWAIPEMNAYRVDHIGSYQHLGNAWSAAHQNARYKKLKQSKVGTYELYKNNTHEIEPKDLVTEIYLPLKK